MLASTPPLLPFSKSPTGAVSEPGLVAGSAVGGSTATAQPLAAGPGLVYIIENDHVSSVITELIVRKNLFGSQVRCYANGQQALDALTLALQDGTHLPSLLVLDLDMPLMDGWEFLDALAALPLARAIRVFVLTSSIDRNDESRALSYGQVTGFFTKPLKHEGVARMLALLQA